MTIERTPASPTDSDEGPIYRPEGYAAQTSVGYLLRRIVTLMAQDVDRKMEAYGLTNAQWLPLLKISAGQAGTVAELARVCELDTGAMTRLLDRVEDKGLCRRTRSTEDRRVVRLELTPEGQQAAELIPAVLCDVQNNALKGFTHDEWRTLRDLLTRIHQNQLEQAEAASVPRSTS